MSVYLRPNSPYYWVYLEHPDADPPRESTKIPHSGPKDTAQQRKRDAQEYYNARMTQLAKARVALPTDAPDAPPVPTFQEFAEWFATHKLPHRRGREREADILTTLQRFFNPTRLDAITKKLALEWMTARRGPTVSARTVNREADLLKSIMQAAVEAGHLTESPLYGMKRLKVLAPKRRLMTPDEETRLLAVLAPDDKAVVLLGLDGLIRLTDILDLYRSDLDLAGERVYVRDPKDPQQASPYYAPLSKRTLAALAALPPPAADAGPYLFPRRRMGKTERDRRGSARQMLQKACAAATPPIPYGRTHGGITFHWATRRTGTTRMLRNGADMKAVQMIGNWKSIAVMHDIYHETTTDAMRAAVELVSPVASDRTPRQRPTRGSRDTRPAAVRVTKPRIHAHGTHTISRTRKFAQ